MGWVIAAGVLSGGAYVGVTRLLERSKDNGLIIVPKYINTPLDVIAVALIELMLPVSLKIANAGGGIQQSELTAIRNFFPMNGAILPASLTDLSKNIKIRLTQFPTQISQNHWVITAQKARIATEKPSWLASLHT